MLKSVRSVTYSVAKLEESQSAFEQFLGYDAVDSGQISPELAGIWNAPACAGMPYSVLQPASEEQVYIRLVEAQSVAGWEPLRCYGWNAAEIHVQDVHGLAERLRESPFQIIGGPRDLLDNGAVVALQVLGPSRELLYLTQISHAGMQANYGSAKAPVGRIFIVVLGAENHAEAIEFYRPFATRCTARKNFNIRVLAQAHGMDPLAAKFDISSAVMQQRFRIEIDAYPPSATDRPMRAGEIPPGMSMVSILVEDLDELNWPTPLQWFSGPASAPYHGARVAMSRGTAGEWIELIESSS